jgi:hypothetical protein
MTKSGNAFRILLCVMLWVPLSGCAATVGQQFRDIMAEIDAQCRKDKMGPYLDKNDPDYIRKRPITDCDILKVKPADPLATEEGRFAYAMQLPPPHDKPKVQYQPGMSAESYFKELCEKEAGEWIFKTVEGVEGVLQGRRREPSSGGYSNLIFLSREFLGVLSSEEGLVQPPYGHYDYFEQLAENGEISGPYIRFFRGAENKKRYPHGFPINRNGLFGSVPYIVSSEPTDSPKSRYGYTSRQVGYKDAIENGIVGNDLIIYDRNTKEILAYRRFFARYWPRSDSRYTRLTNSEGCQPGFTKGTSKFIQKVLVPINNAE